MKQLINEWRKYLKEQEQTNELFEHNVNIIKKAYDNSLYGNQYAYLIDLFTPENAKILTQVELEEDQKAIKGGAYSKIFPIKGNDMMLKLFTHGVNVEEDISRMKKIADQVFKGEASLGQMHFYEFGTLGDTSNNLNEAGTERMTQPEPGYQKPYVPAKVVFKYVIMPKIGLFEKSIAYQQDPEIFNYISEAVQKTARTSQKGISFTDFFNFVMENLADSLKRSFSNYSKELKIELTKEYTERIDEFQDTISKIIHVAYNTFTKEGGTDLHLGNLGFFPQKPDDWFYFDM